MLTVACLSQYLIHCVVGGNRLSLENDQLEVLYCQCICLRYQQLCELYSGTALTLHAGYFFMLLLSVDFFSKSTFSKKVFQEHYQSVKQFGSRSGSIFFCADLGQPNCLQRISADCRSLRYQRKS